MAYFSNGSEGMVFDEECAECPLFDKHCPIALAQSAYNYEACNNPIAREILNLLVKQEANRGYIGCQMKPLIDELMAEGTTP